MNHQMEIKRETQTATHRKRQRKGEGEGGTDGWLERKTDCNTDVQSNTET